VAFKVTGNNVTPSDPQTATATGLTTSGASLILIGVAAGAQIDVADITSVTVNGNAATLVATVAQGSYPIQRVALYKYWSAGALASVSVAVTVDYSSVPSAALLALDVVEVTRTSTGATIGTPVTNTGVSTALATGSVTAAATGSVVVATTYGWNTLTAATGSSTIHENTISGNSLGFFRNNSVTSTGVSYTVSEDLTAANWATVVVEIPQ
jgi:hypothetical protein